MADGNKPVLFVYEEDHPAESDVFCHDEYPTTAMGVCIPAGNGIPAYAWGKWKPSIA